jgi:transcription-repair coupling factor (superfamily II helicase)
LDSLQSEHPETFYQDEYPDTRQKLKTEIDLYFPPEYIADDKERLHIYRRLNDCDDISLIDDFAGELADRFGKLPDKADWLLTYFKLKILTQKAGLQNCQVRNGELIMEFKSNNLPARDKILRFIEPFKEPVRFDTSGNLKVIFELTQHAQLSYKNQTERALKILGHYISLL